ncbi:MAG: nuclease-like protein, partial [Gammaproteobacteria bacterium]|nr:nuclease-like protein [Gammaproteobacteria bacterium]
MALLGSATRWRRIVILFLMPFTGFAGSALKGYAFIEDDGTLRVRGKTVQLYGIHIPHTARTCRRTERPAKCASRAALALDFKVGTNFVECTAHTPRGSRSLTATCHVDGEDLSAYLLALGWAVALPDAPVE